MLCAEDVSLEEIARRFGTPCYVYSRAAIERQFRAFADALAGRPSLVAYSVKANSNLAVLRLMARLGAGFDIVSGGELARVLAAGGDPAQGGVLGRRQERGRDRARRCAPACSASTWNRRPSSSASSRIARRARQARAGRVPRQPRRRREDAPVHLHRPEGKQVRHRLRRCRAPLPGRRAAAGIARHRHRLPHRLAS